ncbi:hypothetical protein LSTR_LSTR003802 [Laodelphax striatellus]|uniref:Uncharacterized protein n=1 Tax=Laodelphax striatellus TaxID=195883 RepID=A0A482XEP6_LAOST|nr:hypothetical protein LSTR_LSTR003802 [Laodelphax striatellus]
MTRGGGVLRGAGGSMNQWGGRICVDPLTWQSEQKSLINPPPSTTALSRQPSKEGGHMFCSVRHVSHRRATPLTA